MYLLESRKIEYDRADAGRNVRGVLKLDVRLRTTTLEHGGTGPSSTPDS